MKKYLFTQKGFTTLLTKEQSKKSFTGLFDWQRWLKHTLADLGVQAWDNCCSNVAPTGFPTRLKADKSGMEYLDTDGVWKAVP